MRQSAILVVLSLFASSLFAAQSETEPRKDSVVRLSPAALQAAIDPATGQLRQLTPEEARELASSFMRSLKLKPATPRVLSNGAVGVELDDSYLNFYMARVMPEGFLQFDCVNTPGDAIALLVGAPLRRIPEKDPGQDIQWEEK